MSETDKKKTENRRSTGSSHSASGTRSSGSSRTDSGRSRGDSAPRTTGGTRSSSGSSRSNSGRTTSGGTRNGSERRTSGSGRSEYSRSEYSRNEYSGRSSSGTSRPRKGKRTREAQVKRQKTLLLIWLCFLVIVLAGVILFIKNKDAILDDLGWGKQTIYEVDADPEINQLIRNYYTAYASCDQKTLQSLVVDPTQFDDMSILEKKAEIVTAYDNLKVYTIPGLNENSKVVYVLSNLSIVNVISKPLDISKPPLYVVKKEGGYLIDNTTLSSDVQNLFESLNQKEDIQKLMQQVKDDQQKCAAEDETFKDFYERLWK